MPWFDILAVAMWYAGMAALVAVAVGCGGGGLKTTPGKGGHGDIHEGEKEHLGEHRVAQPKYRRYGDRIAS
jgi:hypothetical protein